MRIYSKVSLIANKLFFRTSSFHIIRRNVHLQDEKLPEEIKFSPIFKLPHIGTCAVINRCKKLHLLLVGSTVPFSFAGYAINLFDGSIPFIVAAVGVASTTALFSVGQIFTGLVGFIYASDDEQKVKIAYVDFWGKRRDVIYDKKDIHGIENAKWPMNYVYMNLNVQKAKPYKLSLKFADVDSVAFRNIFNYDLSAFEGYSK